MGVSFAIPIDVAMHVKDELAKSGHVTRGRIGVAIQNVNQSLAQSFGLPKPEGALVSSVDAKGPAAHAGVKPGDVILAWNGTPIDQSAELPGLVADTPPGKPAQLKIWRDGHEQTLTVTVARMSDEKVATAEETNPEANSGKLGLSVQESEQGLVVADASGPAAAAGVQEGDVIIAVNNHPVKNVAELRRLVDKAGKHVALLVQREDARIYVPVELG
jgi:serine protease Do